MVHRSVIDNTKRHATTLHRPGLRSKVCDAHGEPAFCRRFEMVMTSPDLISDAMDLHLLRGLSFYDALIVRAAVVGGCQRVLSEDLQNGAVVQGVRIENPFAGM